MTEPMVRTAQPLPPLHTEFDALMLDTGYFGRHQVVLEPTPGGCRRMGLVRAVQGRRARYVRWQSSTGNRSVWTLS